MRNFVSRGRTATPTGGCATGWPLLCARRCTIRLMTDLFQGLSFGPQSTRRLRGGRWGRTRARIEALRPLCPHCTALGFTRAGVELDHIVALHNGGSNDDGNLQLLCEPHHKAKTAIDMGHKAKGCNEHGEPTDPRHSWRLGPARGPCGQGGGASPSPLGAGENHQIDQTGNRGSAPFSLQTRRTGTHK